jgi:hypothetical protein
VQRLISLKNKKAPAGESAGLISTKVHRLGEKPANETLKVKTFLLEVKPTQKKYFTAF